MAETCADGSCNGWLLSGDLYMGLSEGSTDYRHVGETDKFSVTMATELKSFPSKRVGSYGQDACASYINQATEISITLKSTNLENLKLVFLGDSTTIADAEGSVADAAIVASNDNCLMLPNRNISNVIVEDSGSITTYVLDTDYLIDTKRGILKTLSTGSITDAEDLLISYDYAAREGYKIKGVVRGSIIVPIRLFGINLANGKEVEFNAASAVLTSNTEVDFLQDDFLSIELTGRLQIGSDGPFTVDVLN
jgi:hypothetical protein